MKNLLRLLLQWILKYKKRLVYGLLAFFIGQICFFNWGGIGIGNEVYADDTPSLNASFQDKVGTWFQSVSFLHKVVYIVTYPLLIIASKLVDNSLVYGEVFGFDAILWQLWIIIRNLANFTLGFIFLFYIFKYLLTEDKKKDPKWIIVRSLIAGIGIQASWFLMAVLIDLSTILTYSIGGLPVTVLGSNEDDVDHYDPYVLKTLINVDTNDADTINTYLTNVSIGGTSSASGNFYISECVTKYYNFSSDGKEELIVAPKMVYYKDESDKYFATDSNRCHYYGDVYYFSKTLVDFPSCEGTGCDLVQKDYKSALDSFNLNDTSKYSFETVKGYVRDGNLLQIGDAHITGGIIGWSEIDEVYGPEKKYGRDVDNKWIGTGTSKLSSILKGDSYAGVFTSLYFSLLNAGKNIIPSDGSIYLGFLSVALSLLHMLAVGIPLIAMAIVFLMRIGIIWMAIALSPFIVLLKVFELEDKIFKSGSVLEYLSLKNLIYIIFSPAAICFAVSMSTVLVRLINKVNYKDIDSGEPILGFIQLDLGGLGIGLGKLITAIMGVAITWFLMWWAIELSKLGGKDGGIIKSMKNLAVSALKAAPIIPIPGKDGRGTAVSYEGLRQGINKGTNKIFTTLNDEDSEAVKSLLFPDDAKSEATKKLTNSYINNLKQSNVTNSMDWTTMGITMGEKGHEREYKFIDFDNQQKKEIIDSINSRGLADREKFSGANLDNLKNGNNEYELNTKDGDDKYKFDIKNSSGGN